MTRFDGNVVGAVKVGRVSIGFSIVLVHIRISVSGVSYFSTGTSRAEITETQHVRVKKWPGKDRERK